MSDEKPQAFMVQINYKSGIQVELPFTEFEIEFGRQNKVQWKAADTTRRPIFMNLDEIESVYQLGVASDKY